ncbi:hypothetical protein PHLGIDRAFT_115680 [Phlebiopsis gigantea 11061_1 CR5-6]|uniref:G-patch domain-containing protein n=1 Tax=Phlebiopsis gigantea (strain 11061_1 CR5-6) TaxID=745531 RepID=A0A0C3PS95_PHLG1|nr:hypothetical protein PHLGIDRAFT_115680 [Phlebiopsis gigantea 11061_1 CR5-6]
MPIDGHAYLVSQGWEGKGSGLRHGSISRPVIIAQKKNMAGIGKDRDEAFPFWDHVFTTAASSIKIKVYDSDSEDTESSTPAAAFQKTRTGIISNRRPTAGTPALSGTATPTEGSSGSSTPRRSIMAIAKQQAARKTLYSMFFRGPILGSDFEETTDSDQRVPVTVNEETEVKTRNSSKGGRRKRDDEQAAAGSSKGKGRQVDDTGMEDRAGRTLEMKRKPNGEESKKRKRSSEAEVEADDPLEDDEKARRLRKAEKAERKRLRAEKKAAKEHKRRAKEVRNGTVATSQEAMAAVVEIKGTESSPSRSSLGSKKKRKSKDNSNTLTS